MLCEGWKKTKSLRKIKIEFEFVPDNCRVSPIPIFAANAEIQSLSKFSYKEKIFEDSPNTPALIIPLDEYLKEYENYLPKNTSLQSFTFTVSDEGEQISFNHYSFLTFCVEPCHHCRLDRAFPSKAAAVFYIRGNFLISSFFARAYKPCNLQRHQFLK